jgi:hypothetical protein
LLLGILGNLTWRSYNELSTELHALSRGKRNWRAANFPSFDQRTGRPRDSEPTRSAH